MQHLTKQIGTLQSGGQGGLASGEYDAAHKFDVSKLKNNVYRGEGHKMSQQNTNK